MLIAGIIKPGAVESGLKDSVTAELNACGIRISWMGRSTLLEGDVASLYAHHHSSPRWDEALNCLTRTESVLFIADTSLSFKQMTEIKSRVRAFFRASEIDNVIHLPRDHRDARLTLNIALRVKAKRIHCGSS